MITKIKYSYQQEFPFEKLKQFAQKFKIFEDISSITNGHISVSINEDGFEVIKILTKEDLDSICEIGTILNDLLISYNSHQVFLSVDSSSENLEVTYLVYDNIETTKRFIHHFETELELSRLIEPKINDLSTDIDHTQIDPKPCKILNSNESTDPLLTLWNKASSQLQSLYSNVEYQTWIEPIVPSVVGNQLILNCPSEFSKEWLERRYKKDIIKIVQLIDPTQEETIVKVVGKDAKPIEQVTNNEFTFKVDEPLFLLMLKTYERDTKNSDEWTFEKYFKQVLQLYCLDRMDKS